MFAYSPRSRTLCRPPSRPSLHSAYLSMPHSSSSPVMDIRRLHRALRIARWYPFAVYNSRSTDDIDTPIIRCNPTDYRCKTPMWSRCAKTREHLDGRENCAVRQARPSRVAGGSCGANIQSSADRTCLLLQRRLFILGAKPLLHKPSPWHFRGLGSLNHGSPGSVSERTAAADGTTAGVGSFESDSVGRGMSRWGADIARVLHHAAGSRQRTRTVDWRWPHSLLDPDAARLAAILDAHRLRCYRLRPLARPMGRGAGSGSERGGSSGPANARRTRKLQGGLGATPGLSWHRAMPRQWAGSAGKPRTRIGLLDLCNRPATPPREISDPYLELTRPVSPVYNPYLPDRAPSHPFHTHNAPRPPRPVSRPPRCVDCRHRLLTRTPF